MLSNKNSGKWEARAGGIRAYGVCLPKQPLHISYFFPVSQQKGVSERLGGRLAAGWDQLTTNNKFPGRNGSEDLEILFTLP